MDIPGWILCSVGLRSRVQRPGRVSMRRSFCEQFFVEEHGHSFGRFGNPLLEIRCSWSSNIGSHAIHDDDDDWPSGVWMRHVVSRPSTVDSS